MPSYNVGVSHKEAEVSYRLPVSDLHLCLGQTNPPFPRSAECTQCLVVLTWLVSPLTCGLLSAGACTWYRRPLWRSQCLPTKQKSNAIHWISFVAQQPLQKPYLRERRGSIDSDLKVLKSSFVPSAAHAWTPLKLYDDHISLTSMMRMTGMMNAQMKWVSYLNQQLHEN